MNLFQAILPSIRLFQFFCLCPVSVISEFQFSTRAFFLTYSVLQLIVRICIFFYGIFAKHLFPQNEYQLVAVIDTVLICGVRLLEIIILLEALMKRKLDKTLIENFEIIDKMMKERLKIDMDFQHFYRKNLIYLICWIGIFLSISATIIYLSVGDLNYVYFRLTYFVPFFLSSLAYYQINLWINLIQRHFRILKTFISHLECDTTKHPTKMANSLETFQSTLATDYHRIINLNSNLSYNSAILIKHFIIVRDLYNRLWIQTNLVNERFRWSTILMIGNDFISLLSNFYWMLICMLHYSMCRDMSITACFLWSLLNILHIFLLCGTCHKTVDEANGIAYAIHRITRVIYLPKLSSLVNIKYIIFFVCFNQIKK